MIAVATVDRSAIRHNVAALRATAGDLIVCAVVKADGYGHGAVEAATAALDSGAGWLAVATPAEAVALVDAGVDASVPLLLLSEPPSRVLREHADRLPRSLRFTIAGTEGLVALEELGGSRPWPVHMKVDTGMHRVGVDPHGAVELARAIVASTAVTLEGVWTHFAVADDPDDDFTATQTARFTSALDALEAAGIHPGIVHAANSAAAIAHPATRFDMVRVGIAIYGVPPADALADRVDLRPALRLAAPVTAVRVVEAGESVGYGRHWYAQRPTRVATVAIGYADGIRRASGAAGVEVLVRGARSPVLGVVTMDQLMIAVADDVRIGDEVVMIGAQGDHEITANEIAGRLDTIGYEVLTSIGPRVSRVHTG